VGAAEVPELLALNKVDLLDEVSRARLARQLPGALPISAGTGEGIGQLLATIATRLPHPPVELAVLLPYDRGDLVDRAHREGEVLAVEHTADGTRVRLRAPAGLAHALDPYRAPGGWPTAVDGGR
jgi:GTPase